MTYTCNRKVMTLIIYRNYLPTIRKNTPAASPLSHQKPHSSPTSPRRFPFVSSGHRAQRRPEEPRRLERGGPLPSRSAFLLRKKWLLNHQTAHLFTAGLGVPANARACLFEVNGLCNTRGGHGHTRRLK